MEENKTKEFEFFGGSLNGFLMCFIAIILWGCAIFSLISGIIAADAERSCAGWFVTFALLVIIAVICSCGFTMLEPNEAKKLGRGVKGFNQSLWDEQKETIMRCALMSKARACKEFREALLTEEWVKVVSNLDTWCKDAIEVFSYGFSMAGAIDWKSFKEKIRYGRT